MKLSYLIILLVMNCFWAGAISIYKVLSQQMTTGAVVTLRFGVAALIMAVAWPFLPGKAPRGLDLVKTIVMGLIVFMLGHRAQVLGTKMGSAGNSSVLMGMEPILTAVAAAFFLREHVGPRRWAGFALAMMGVGLLNGLMGGGFKWVGLGASLIFISSFLCEAAYSIIGKPLIERASMTKILAIALLAGTAANLILDGSDTLAAIRAMPLNSWLMVLYLATICTSIGYAVWFVVIKETDVNITAMTIFAQPLAGVAIARYWLHEPLHWGQFWGSLTIVAGLVLGMSKQIKTPAGPEKLHFK